MTFTFQQRPAAFAAAQRIRTLRGVRSRVVRY